MSVRANWHLAHLEADDDADPMSDLLNLAKPIDLSTDRARLQSELVSLGRAEGLVYERTGASCDLKEQPGYSCFTCPHYASKPDEGPQWEVCQIGRKQWAIADQLDRHTEIEELEVLAFSRMLEEECDELAEALLEA